MTTHVTIEEIARLRRGELSPGDLAVVARHLSSCVECAEKGRASVDLGRAVSGLRKEIEAELAEGHPSVERELTSYLDGTLSREARDEVDAHLECCAVCREDVADLTSERRKLRRIDWRIVYAIAAAVSIGLVGGLLVLRSRTTDVGPQAPVTAVVTRPPVVPQKSYGEWDGLVRGALTSGRIEPPDEVRQLRLEAGVLRGEGPTASNERFSPAGEIVLSDRPEFSWIATEGANYVMSVVSEGREIATSGILRGPRWTPEKPLARGKFYMWQVEVRPPGAEPVVIPAPPAPPALFRVADAKAQEQLEAAQKRDPDDHLLRGIIAAHFGLQKLALDELRAHLAAHPDDREARRLAESVRRW